MNARDLDIANSSYLRAIRILTDLEKSIPVARSLLKGCESQLSAYLQSDHCVYIGTLSELSATLSGKLVEFALLKHRNAKLINEARQSIETLRKSFQISSDFDLRAAEISKLCDAILSRLGLVTDSLEGANSTLNVQLEKISEVALTHDTPAELLSIAKELIERSKA